MTRPDPRTWSGLVRRIRPAPPRPRTHTGKAPGYSRDLPSPTLKTTVKIFVGVRAKSANSCQLPRSPLANHCESEEPWRAGNPAEAGHPHQKRSPHRVRNAPQKRKENKKKKRYNFPRGAGGFFDVESKARG